VTQRGALPRPASRAELEKLISADMRAITAQSDRIGRHFARQNQVSPSDFHALLHIMVAETAETPLTLTQLRKRMDVSQAAITYLVDRMIDAGHIRREPDPADRRKWLLRYGDNGMALAREFFSSLGTHLHLQMNELDDNDLFAAHRVFSAMIAAMSSFEDELATAPAEPSSAEAPERAQSKLTRRRRA